MTKATTPAPARAPLAARRRPRAGIDGSLTPESVSKGSGMSRCRPSPSIQPSRACSGSRVRNVHEVSDGKLTYTLKIQVTPDKALDEGKESVLAAARDKLAEEVGGKVVEESNAQIAGYEGHAYRLDVAGPKPVVVAARAAIVGKRTVIL